MDKFEVVTGISSTMLDANVNTDVIMPKQFLKGIDRLGLAKGLFYDLRFLNDGSENSEFILNEPRKKGTKFMIVGPNFGCGSSREHAVWGFKQFGIRAIIGTTFAGIFHDNCLRNGLLIIQLNKSKLKVITDYEELMPDEKIEIDLPAQEIRLSNQKVIPFHLDGVIKQALVNGLDTITQTLQYQEQINNFEEAHAKQNPWLF
jgi:3-isopropylmalate/(R)-2-methylmalate dehydratase small subunit